jgi:hypothetical protein
MKHYSLFFLLLSFLFCGGCQETKQAVEISYAHLYGVDSITVESKSMAIIPYYSRVEDDSSRRAFYADLDTSLLYQGVLYQDFADDLRNNWCALDLRINNIEITSLINLDSQHPAGSIVNDLFSIRYFYKLHPVEKSLASFHYGDLMLCDLYFSSPVLLLCLKTEDKDNYLAQPGPCFEIRIKDAFGKEFSDRF